MLTTASSAFDYLAQPRKNVKGIFFNNKKAKHQLGFFVAGYSAVTLWFSSVY